MQGSVGLLPVPRGLSRELNAFLSSLVEQVRILSGASRGTSDSRALRASEATSVGTGTSVIGQASVGAEHIKPKSITSEKLADGCITQEKLGMGSVQQRAISADAVTEDKIKAGAVTKDKIAAGAVTEGALAESVLPIIVCGHAKDGKWMQIPGAWRERPHVAMEFLEALGTKGDAGPSSLREVLDEQGNGTGMWEFFAVGNFLWLCVGWRA